MLLPRNSSTYLSHLDTSKLVWGLETVRKIVTFAPLSELTGEEISPGLNLEGENLRNWVR